MAAESDHQTLVEVVLQLPDSMTLNKNGRIVSRRRLDNSSIIFAQDVAKQNCQIREKALFHLRSIVGDDSSIVETPWKHLARRVSTADDCNLEQANVNGKEAFLVKKSVEEGTELKIFSQQEEPASSVPAPLDLSSANVLSGQSPFVLSQLSSPQASLRQSLLAIPNLLQVPGIASSTPRSTLGMSNPSFFSPYFFQTRPSQPGRRARQKTMLPCQICGKAFDRPSLLKRHMRTHTGEKPHICEICNKGFSTSSSLNTHRRIHSGEKPHQCGICGKRFTASSNLYYHRMTHNKEKPHKCHLCNKSFPTPGDLKSHQFVHNGICQYKCPICNKAFSKQTNVKNHMLAHITGFPMASYSGEPEASYPTSSNIVTSVQSNMTSTLTSSIVNGSNSTLPTGSPSVFSTLNLASGGSELRGSGLASKGDLAFAMPCPICHEIMPSISIFQLHLRGHLLALPSLLLNNNNHRGGEEEEGVKTLTESSLECETNNNISVDDGDNE